MSSTTDMQLSLLLFLKAAQCIYLATKIETDNYSVIEMALVFCMGKCRQAVAVMMDGDQVTHL